jgi:hypothetical protein
MEMELREVASWYREMAAIWRKRINQAGGD